MVQEVREVLDQRGERYGNFEEVAYTAHAIKGVLMAQVRRHSKVLLPFQEEALDMMVMKLSRIVNGDPNYEDNWVDIAGYAQLVVDCLRRYDQSKE